jgi:hypothetical protein
LELSGFLYTASTWAIPILVAITFHEAAHAYAAWKLGDDTASGRWTRIEASWVVEQRVGWWAMSRGGRLWRGLLSI